VELSQRTGQLLIVCVLGRGTPFLLKLAYRGAWDVSRMQWRGDGDRYAVGSICQHAEIRGQKRAEGRTYELLYGIYAPNYPS